MHTRIEFISRLIGAVVLAAALAIVGVQLATMFNLDPLRYGVAFGVGGGVLGAVLGFLFTPYLTDCPRQRPRRAAGQRAPDHAWSRVGAESGPGH